MASRYMVDRYLESCSFSSHCMHRNVVIDTSGSRRFVEGEVDDNILVRALCLDCGEYLTESEVRGTWSGEYHSILPLPDMEDDDEFPF